jgi:type I restriction enzyme S subunit
MSNKVKTTKMNQNKQKLVPELRFPEFKDDGEWKRLKFSEICKFVRGPFGGSLKKDIFVQSGYAVYEQSHAIHKNFSSFRYYITEKKYKELKRFSVLPNDIIMSCSGTMGKYAIIPKDSKEGVINQALLKLTVKENHNLRFVKSVLELPIIQENLLSQSAGGAIKNVVSVGQIKEMELYIPQPKEQQKIADCLSSIDDLITAESEKLESIKNHKKGLMQNLFPSEGKTIPNFRFPEFKGNGEWEVDTLVRIAKFRRGSFPQPYGLSKWYDNENGEPFVQVYDVSNDLSLKPKTKNKISKLAADQSVFIAKGTLIVTLQGSIGRVAITQYDAYIDRTLLIFEEFFRPIEKLFFAYVVQNLFDIEKEKAPGGIIKTITKESLSAFEVKLPSQPEQQKIADCLSSVDDLITSQEQKIDDLKKHKKGLMHQLFPNIDGVLR